MQAKLPLMFLKGTGKGTQKWYRCFPVTSCDRNHRNKYIQCFLDIDGGISIQGRTNTFVGFFPKQDFSFTLVESKKLCSHKSRTKLCCAIRSPILQKGHVHRMPFTLLKQYLLALLPPLDQEMEKPLLMTPIH